jgi:hypothetical protein
MISLIDSREFRMGEAALRRMGRSRDGFTFLGLGCPKDAVLRL